MNEHETIDDILREMRDEQRNDFLTNSDLRNLADRIAVARRREDENRPIPGNAAALREALKTAIGDFNEIHRNLRITDAECEYYESRCIAALAAPARNCDRFETAEDAERAFGGVLPDDIGDHRAFIAWLFAPAEGGAQ